MAKKKKKVVIVVPVNRDLENQIKTWEGYNPIIVKEARRKLAQLK